MDSNESRAKVWSVRHRLNRILKTFEHFSVYLILNDRINDSLMYNYNDREGDDSVTYTKCMQALMTKQMVFFSRKSRQLIINFAFVNIRILV